MLNQFLRLALLASIAFTSCDTYLHVGDARVGLTLGEQGTPEILYAACDGERIARINMSIVHDNLGGDDDRILWQIDANPRWAEGVLLSAVPGSPPPVGFATTVELQEGLPADEVIVVAVWFKPEGLANSSSFRPTQLRSDRVLSDLGEQISREEFLRVAEDSCDGRVAE